MAVNVISGNTYIITNVKAGTAIDLSVGDNTTGIPIPPDVPTTAHLFDNRLVTGWEPHGQANQRVSKTQNSVFVTVIHMLSSTVAVGLDRQYMDIQEYLYRNLSHVRGSRCRWNPFGGVIHTFRLAYLA